MDVPRFPALRWIIAGLAAFVFACLAAPPCMAATSLLDVGDQVVVVVLVKGKGNDVTIRSWDRPAVQLESGDDVPSVERHTALFGTLVRPLAVPIPPMPWVHRDATGQILGGGMLPPEDFPYAAFRPGAHDEIRISADQPARLVITVPASTGILQVRVGGGKTLIDGYRGGNLLLLQQSGRVQIVNTSTTAFAQMAFGVLSASDDTFDRIRVRSSAAHVVFEHCRAKQIEATTVSGSILYDGGVFEPGLARFESQSGNIALGITSPAQLSGRSQEGRVFTAFERRNGVSVEQRADGDTSVNVNNGPLVNAISGHGNVFFYEGTLANRRMSQTQEWRAVHQLFSAHKHARGEPQPPQPPRPPHGGVRFLRLP